MNTWGASEASLETTPEIDRLIDNVCNAAVTPDIVQIKVEMTRGRTVARSRSWQQRIEDQCLVSRFQAGETEAFSILASKYQGKLMRVVSRLIQDRADAEDVVQEALIRAYRALPAFRGDSAFYTWLFTIGMNLAKNFRKRTAKRACLSVRCQGHPDDDVHEQPVAVDMHTPMAELEQKQLLQALNEILDTLPAHLSSPLILCHIEGMSYEEISHVMSCPLGTVRSRIFRARELICLKMAPLLGPRFSRQDISR